jgi:hypothetical protein
MAGSAGVALAAGPTTITATKTVNPSTPVKPGDPVTYTIVISNPTGGSLSFAMADEISPLAGLIQNWGASQITSHQGTFQGAGDFGSGSLHYGTAGSFYNYTSGIAFTGTLGGNSVVTLTVPSMVRDTFTGTLVTNTAKFWVWDPAAGAQVNAFTTAATVSVKTRFVYYFPIIERRSR